MTARTVTIVSIVNNPTSVEPLSLTFITSGNTTRGVAVAGMKLEASGGVAPYTFETDGQPDGIEFDEDTGIASGTPTGIGHVIFTATVTDHLGTEFSTTYTINVLSHLSVVSLPPGVADLGIVYAGAIKLTGNTGALSFTTTGSSGLNLDAAGNLTGTPSGSGREVFTTTATDAGTGDTLDIEFAVLIGDAITIDIVGASGIGDYGPVITFGTVGQHLRFDLDINGGTPPYNVSFAVFHDLDPVESGLTVDASGMFIDGIVANSPSPGGIDWLYIFEVSVTDSLGLQYHEPSLPLRTSKWFTWAIFASGIGFQQEGVDAGVGTSRLNFSFPTSGTPSIAAGASTTDIVIPITVVEIDAALPLTVTPVDGVWSIAIARATTTVDGYLAHADFVTFNAKLSDAPNDANTYGRHAGAWASLPTTIAWTSVTGKPTTLAGYGITDGLTDAPNNASTYGRKGAAWVALPTTTAWASITGTPTTLAGYGITNGLTDAPNDANTYGRHAGAWTAISASAAWGAITGTLSAQTDLQTALNALAPLAAPTFTGVPAAPTAATATNTTQLATCAFVHSVANALTNSTLTFGNGFAAGSYDGSANKTIAMGAPSTLTAATTNALTATSHTHAITGFLPLTGGTLTGTLTGTTITAATISDSSDAKFKSDVRDLRDGMELIRMLMPRRFFNKLTERDDVGFIAQDVQVVFPEIVSVDDDETLSVAYQRLTAPIIAALHQLDARLKRLESRL